MSGRTKIKLPWQSKVADDIDLENKSLKNLVMPEDKPVPEPISPTDVINRQYVEGIVGEAGSGAKIGPAEDGVYTDGLFEDFTTDTLVGTAVDRFNEVLKALAPTPAPALTNIGVSTSGVTGKLTFGTSNVISGYTAVPTKDLGSTFGSVGGEIGIIGTGITVTGDIASTVAGGVNNKPYPAKAFGDADKGYLRLELNGAVIHSVDLTTWVSGSSLNANGSGFVLSAASGVKFESGQTLDLFKYRTGTWTVNSADQRNGYNVIKVKHEYLPGMVRETNTYAWVVDAETTVTTFSNENLVNPVMTGNRKISGVTYHTSGTVDYSVTVNNAYRNTYSQSSSALDYTGTNIVTVDEALPLPADQNSTVSLNKTMSINNASRLLNGSVGVNIRVDRTIQSDATSTGASISGFLVDNVSDDSTDTMEPFNGEGYRMHTGIDITNTTYGTGKQSSSYDWDGNQNLINGDANHNTGLLISGGRLSYPSNTSHIPGITGGNFSNITLGPGGNPDYSTASGNRTYLRYFYSPLSYSNFKLNVQASNTTFVKKSVALSGNNLWMEILAPNTTKDANGNVVWKDAVEPHNANDRDIGCFAGTFGDTIPTNWGITLGAENTSTSGHVIVVRITASPTWTGNIDSITLTWL